MTAPDPSVDGVVMLERQGYKRRRLSDAARILPLIGGALLMIPLLWPGTQTADPDIEPVRTSQAILYIFGAWAGLIGAAMLFGAAVRLAPDSGGSDGPEQG